MAKQLMIYERAVPISSERHRDWSVEMGRDYGFARDVNSVPLLAGEFIAAATDHAIVFAGNDEQVFPSVVLGIRDNENANIAADGTWTGGYIPAFLRRYPFVFSRSDDGASFTLCMDEEFEGFNKDGRGERLFDSQGNRTQYLESMLNFVRQYQALFERTQAFCKTLKEHGVLRAGQANFNLGAGGQAQLGGFYTIDREKLKSLPAETLHNLARTDELELCYVHLQSLNNLTPMARRVAEGGAAAPGDAARGKPARAETETS